MNYRDISFIAKIAINLSAAASLGIVLDGCATKPPPNVPPPTASEEATPGATVLTQDQMAKFCQAEPEGCSRAQLGQPFMVGDVKVMAKLGFNPDTIISELKVSRSVFNLTAEAIIDLKNSGVGDQVLNFMLNTPNPVATAATTPVPAPVPTAEAETATVQTPPPAPVEETQPPTPGVDYVWVGGDWVWNGGWVWTGGHWALPPYAHGVWVRGGWRRGPDGYHRRPGFWR